MNQGIDKVKQDCLNLWVQFYPKTTKLFFRKETGGDFDHKLNERNWPDFEIKGDGANLTCATGRKIYVGLCERTL